MTYSEQGGAQSALKEAGKLIGGSGPGEHGEAARRAEKGGASATRAIAKAVARAADDLEPQLPTAATYVRGAAEKLQDASSAIERGNIDELMNVVGAAARSQPVAVFSAAAIIGFAFSRFLKGSANEAAPGGQ